MKGFVGGRFAGIKGHEVAVERGRYSFLVKQAEQVFFCKMPGCKKRKISVFDDKALVSEKPIHGLLRKKADMGLIMQKPIARFEKTSAAAVKVRGAQHQSATRTKNATNFTQGWNRVVKMLDDVMEHHGIKMPGRVNRVFE